MTTQTEIQMGWVTVKVRHIYLSEQEEKEIYESLQCHGNCVESDETHWLFHLCMVIDDDQYIEELEGIIGGDADRWSVCPGEEFSMEAM